MRIFNGDDRKRFVASAIRFISAVFLFGTFTVGGMTPANAMFFDPNVAEDLQHILECNKLLIEDAINGTDLHTPACGIGGPHNFGAGDFSHGGGNALPGPVVEDEKKHNKKDKDDDDLVPVEECPINASCQLDAAPSQCCNIG